MLAYGQRFVMGRAGDGAVDLGKPTSAFLIPSPDIWRRVRGIGHVVFRIIGRRSAHWSGFGNLNLFEINLRHSREL